MQLLTPGSMTQAMTSDIRDNYFIIHIKCISTTNPFPKFCALENTYIFPDYRPSLKWLHTTWEQATKQFYVLLW